MKSRVQRDAEQLDLIKQIVDLPNINVPGGATESEKLLLIEKIRDAYQKIEDVADCLAQCERDKQQRNIIPQEIHVPKHLKGQGGRKHKDAIVKAQWEEFLATGKCPWRDKNDYVRWGSRRFGLKGAIKSRPEQEV